MKTLYEAANAVEAHMLQDLLRQEGIETRLDGAFLQGAIGELPAAGLVRLVVVDEADFGKGREVVTRWEAASALEAGPASAAAGSVGGARRGGRWPAALMGLLVGLVAGAAFMRAPVNSQGVDHDGDGRLDEVWTLSPSGATLAGSIDRNFDGQPDYRVSYDTRGAMQGFDSDDNFDGVFENHCTVRLGNTQSCESDTDGDGLNDMKQLYQHGVQQTTTYIDKHSGLPFRVEHYVLGKLSWAEVDTDQDGQLDQRVDYGAQLQVRGSSALRAEAQAR